MVNQPAYNPNDRDQIKAKTYRNRAVTDIVEPGSSIKPFVVAAGLASGRFNDHTASSTPTPGYIKVGAKLLEDPHNLGAVNLATILAKSSNVGMTKVALALEPAQMYGTLDRARLRPGDHVRLSRRVGRPAASLLALAAGRHLLDVARLRPVDHAAAARACVRDRGVATASRGRFPSCASRRRRRGERALDARVARMLIHLLEAVVAPDGGGKQAAIPGYTVAGKTGTAWKATAGGYATDRYLAVFGGIAPASNPRLAAVVIIDEPGAGKYYGGDVAAPVFSGVVGGALRLLAVPPDAPVRDENAPVQRQVAIR